MEKSRGLCFFLQLFFLNIFAGKSSKFSIFFCYSYERHSYSFVYVKLSYRWVKCKITNKEMRCHSADFKEMWCLSLGCVYQVLVLHTLILLTKLSISSLSYMVNDAKYNQFHIFQNEFFYITCNSAFYI